MSQPPIKQPVIKQLVIKQAPVFFFRDAKDREKLKAWRSSIRANNQTLVFTNGVFDIIHTGHATYLTAARNLGDALIIGLNSDVSVRTIKGPKRPLQVEEDRANLLASLKATDAVVIFEEETPFNVISFVVPDIVVKGGDYLPENIVGRDVVEAAGGRVLALPFVEGKSTSGIVERIVERYG